MDAVWTAVDQERRSLHTLLTTLSPQDWRQPSLCAHWQVRDVVAHLALSTRATAGRVLVELIRARGSIDRMVGDSAVRHARTTADHQLLAELRASVGSRFTAIGTTPADRLMDLLVHGQDIAVPLGLRRAMPVGAALLAIDRVWNARFPFPATTQLAGYRLRAVDAEWATGTGPLIEGPVSALLLLSTGRDSAALPELTGPGVGMLTGG